LCAYNVGALKHSGKGDLCFFYVASLSISALTQNSVAELLFCSRFLGFKKKKKSPLLYIGPRQKKKEEKKRG
jgi:hypothetical protein